ncbi:MAG: pilus assembly protein [Micavibrio sp.]|nr:MAG: pilus assembly protein [Micavibrio sp.]
MNTIQIVLIALIFIIIIGIGIAFSLNQEVERKKRVMATIKGRSGVVGNAPSEQDAQNKRRAEIARKLKDDKEEDDKSKKKQKTSIAVMMGQAGLNITTKQFWMYSIVSMVIFTFVAKVIFHANPFILLMVAITGLLGFPRIVLKRLAAKRQKKFLTEFADALEAVVRLLKAGMPVSEAVKMISREFEGPVGEEMSIIYDKQKIGVPLHEAATEATKRMPLTEMQMFATGLAIQSQTGSSLSEVLSNLANVIRARFKLKRKIKALSSEAIASASIIGALPNVVAGGMWFVNREYINVLFTDPFGKVLLAGAVIWMCLGILVMKVMINFKI